MCRLLAYFDNPANRNSKMSLLYYLFKKILIQWTLPTQCPTLLSLTSKAVCSINWKANIIIGISVALQCWSPWLCNTSTFLTFSFHKYSRKKFPWSIIATRWTMSFHEFIKFNCHVLWISCKLYIYLRPSPLGMPRLRTLSRSLMIMKDLGWSCQDLYLGRILSRSWQVPTKILPRSWTSWCLQDLDKTRTKSWQDLATILHHLFSKVEYEILARSWQDLDGSLKNWCLQDLGNWQKQDLGKILLKSQQTLRRSNPAYILNKLMFARSWPCTIRIMTRSWWHPVSNFFSKSSAWNLQKTLTRS